ncbi:hypothetical protein [Paraburkholderia sp. Cpub6]|uniref:hypothetical protein n=1 Tax=Paraburkholderia sp. Cpub6 TaxID=2723094 RepID=UPI0021A2F910|nr:hypothetical protein [Paraburkholderia sp. Cpub6]
MAWRGAQPRAALFTTTVTRAEIRYGLHLLPDGSRKGALATAVDAIFVEDFAGRLLAFDSDAADANARMAGSRESAGRPISQFDAMIAARTHSEGRR